jgi:hypothetical protein
LPRALGRSHHPCPHTGLAHDDPRREAQFRYYDFPPLDHPGRRALAWLQDLRPDVQLIGEMAGALYLGAQSDGIAATRHFIHGNGRPFVHGPTSSLGAMALPSPTFRETLAEVQQRLEQALRAAHDASGPERCLFSQVNLTPGPEDRLPNTNFTTRLGQIPLKWVFGGTQGESMAITSIAHTPGSRSYSVTLEVQIHDTFGVDDDDIYMPPERTVPPVGLVAFWVLQHRRRRGPDAYYQPYINTLLLRPTIQGSF